MEGNKTEIVEQKCNKQFFDLIKSEKRFNLLQGGTRSGKTYAVCQYLCYLLTTTNKSLTISIIRKTLPALKASVQRDFIAILEETGIYDLGTHNKAENTFKYNQHLIEFFSVDEPAKIRGRKRSIAFLNECNEFSLEDFRQINMRTESKVIMDFNPSDPVHWIYSEIIPRQDCDHWITTYKDNLFLPTELVNEIENLKKDEDYWRVYGEGQRAVFSSRQIFNNWNWIPHKEFPEHDVEGECYIGLDWGYSNDPTAAILAFKRKDKLYIHEILYRTGMTNADIVDFLKIGGYGNTLTFADSAEPKSIETCRQLGLMMKGATKGAGSINAGISLIKEFDVYASIESRNLFTEYNNYYWETLKDGTIINKPKDSFNHLKDALRYLCLSQYSKRVDFYII